jgi:hypothetical protein
MRRFNQLWIDISVVSFCASLVLSCTKPATGPEDPTSGANGRSNATFYVVKGKNNYGKVGAVDPNARWNISQSTDFNVTACIFDRSTRQPSRGQKYIVSFDDEKRALAPITTATEDGCLTWTDPIAYTHYAGQSGWVIKERTITGVGSNTGSQTLRLAFNPWNVGEHARDPDTKELLFLRQGEDAPPVKVFEPSQAAAALAGELQESAQLLVEEVKIKPVPIGENKTMVKYNLQVQMLPRVQYRRAAGTVTYEPVEDGDFEVRVQVLGTEGGEKQDQKVILLGGDLQTVRRSKDTNLNLEFTVTQERRLNRGNLEMVVEVTPINLNGYTKLRPFNGVYRFGVGTTLKDADAPIANDCDDQSDKSKCRFNEYVQKASNFQQLEADGYVRANSRYLFSTLKLRFGTVMNGETATQRTVAYTANTCITSTNGETLANTRMSVVYHKDPKNEGDRPESSDPIVVDTDDNGCLKWAGYVFHKYYAPEQYYEKNVTIYIGDHPVPGGFSRDLKFYLNPWDDKFTFGWDSTEFTKEFFKRVMDRQKQKIASRFFLGDYGFHTVRFLYNIDEFMELEVKKWVLMGLSPRVLRYSGITNARKMVEQLRDGIYLMKVAIQKSYLDPHDNSSYLIRNNPKLQAEIVNVGPAKIPLRAKDFVTTNQVLVRVVDGYVVYPIELVMRDLRLMRVRSNFIIELETADERMVQAYYQFRNYSVNSKTVEVDGKVDNQSLADDLRSLKSKLLQKAGVPLSQIDQRLQDASLHPNEQNTLDLAREKFGSDEEVAQARKSLEARFAQTKVFVKDALACLQEQYNKPEINFETPLSPECVKKVSSQFGIGEELAQANNDSEFKKTLNNSVDINDFSKVALPKKEDIDLDIFREDDSGLEPRSFVGPVIFLSNAYSDSMRATDNLDEANCVNPEMVGDPYVQTQDELDKEFDASDEIRRSESSLFMHRQNNAYVFSKYFSSLNNMCYKQVDRPPSQSVDGKNTLTSLIEDERKIDKDRHDASVAASLKLNYVHVFGLDYVSLKDEPLQKIKEDCINEKTDARDCLENTNERTIKVGTLEPWINKGLGRELARIQSYEAGANSLTFFGGSDTPRSTVNHWDPMLYEKLFFEKSGNSRVALCNLLSNRIADELQHGHYASWRYSEGEIADEVNHVCLGQDGLIHDIKYKVNRTGNYNFLGGLNLNFNVGIGFSVGTSSGWSGGFGFDAVDALSAGSNLLGNVAGGLTKSQATNIGAILKPLSLKAGYGSGIGASEGTAVSESTYLVSQIAGFKLNLDSYERCAVVRLTPDALSKIEWPEQLAQAGPLWLAHQAGLVKDFNGLGMVDHEILDVQLIFSHGLFVCEGTPPLNRPPAQVEEMYFYFTQHFTEGDMLDQADLYNQPWLMSLRGMRDFSRFVSHIRNQGSVDMWGLAKGFAEFETGTGKALPSAWALWKLASAYRKVLPSFPGYYTVLDPGEDRANYFALNEAHDTYTADGSFVSEDGVKIEKHSEDNHDKWLLDMVDHDKNNEVFHPSIVDPDNQGKLQPPAASEPGAPYSASPVFMPPATSGSTP